MHYKQTHKLTKWVLDLALNCQSSSEKIQSKIHYIYIHIDTKLGCKIEYPTFPCVFVGRCARAGRAGVAYSLVAGDEVCYLLDLQLFLGRALEFVTADTTSPPAHAALARIPQHILDDQLSKILMWHTNNGALVSYITLSCNVRHFL